MEKRHVTGIDFAFDVLEIIAVLKSLVYVDVILWNQRPLELRQFRHNLLRTHICPDHTASFAGWIGRLTDLLFEAALDRLVRHINALAIHIEFPAVINAAQPVLFVAAEKQRCAPMRTVARQKSHFAVGIAKHNQMFRKNSETNRRTIRFRQLTRNGNRQPKTAQQISNLCAWSSAAK